MASQDDDRQSALTDLFGSLKIVSNAAQSAFNKQTDDVDYGQVAGAASNLLGAASQYGNLDEQQGFSKYVDQAQDYLQKYQKSSKSGTPPQSATDEPLRTESPPSDDFEPKDPDTTTPAADEERTEPKETAPAEEVNAEPKRKDEQEEEGEDGGGAGDYLKLAQGFLGKSDKEEGGGNAGVGDYVNIAKGLFGK